MLHLSQFNLKLTFVATGSLGKNLENQANSLHDLDAPNLLEIALLDGCQGMIKQDVVDLLRLEALANLGDLPAADKCSGIGACTMHRDSPPYSNTGRAGQCGEFVQRAFVASYTADSDADQKRPAICLLQVQVASLSCWKFTGRAGTTVEIACL